MWPPRASHAAERGGRFGTAGPSPAKTSHPWTQVDRVPIASRAELTLREREIGLGDVFELQCFAARRAGQRRLDLFLAAADRDQLEMFVSAGTTKVGRVDGAHFTEPTEVEHHVELVDHADRAAFEDHRLVA